MVFQVCFLSHIWYRNKGSWIVQSLQQQRLGNYSGVDYYAKEYYDGIIAIREEFCIRPVQLRFTAIMLCFAMLFIALIGADGRILSSDRSGKGVM